MDLLGHSMLVLLKEWPANLGLLGILFLGGGAVFFGLKAIFKDNLTFGEYFSLGAGGALLPLLLWNLLSGSLNLFLKIKTGFIWGWVILFVVAAFAAWHARGARMNWKIPKLPSTALVLILICSILVRLAFIWDLQVPLYFDSAMHYSVIMDLIKNFASFETPVFQSFVGGYYHVGFHALIGSLSLALHLPVQNVMLIFGQIILALIPLPLFFIIRQETKLDAPALFAILMAGWAWYMPAHMLDWGKYPALTSMLSFGFAVCSLILLRQSAGRQRWILICLASLSILFSTFIHTRSLVIICMFIASYLIAAYWHRLPGLPRILLLALAVAGLLALVFIIQSRPVLRLAFDPYLGSQGWMTLFVLILVPLALKEFPLAAFTWLLFMFFLIGSLLISVTWFLPVYDAQTLLDRPFVEGVLFFPLAMLGGLGYAGLLGLLKSSGFWQIAHKNQLEALMALCLFGTLFARMPHYNYYPSDCCKLFGEKDAAAFEWLDRNTPASANILVASFETTVFESNQPAGYSGADAGIWITPFIDRKVVLAPYGTDFTSRGAFDEICKQGAAYIYAGWTNQSFNKAQLANRPEWYASQLALPGIQVFRLMGCP